MPRNYRPRPYQERICAHCAARFETNHSRTKYCGDSCRVKACYTRQAISEPLTAKVGGDLSFSLPNVGVATAGATGAALLNYLVNDRPAQQQVMSLLESIKKGQTKVDLAPLVRGLEYLVDYVGAQVAADPFLAHQMQLARQKRLSSVAQPKQQKTEAGQSALDKLLGDRQKPR